MSEHGFSSDQFNNLTFTGSFKQTAEQIDKSFFNNDHNAIRDTVSYQRQYFNCQDIQDIQQLCYKKEATINSEENERNKQNYQQDIFVQLDISNLQEKSDFILMNTPLQKKEQQELKPISNIFDGKESTQLCNQQNDGKYIEPENKDYLINSTMRKDITSNQLMMQENISNLSFSPDKYEKQCKFQNKSQRNDKKTSLLYSGDQIKQSELKNQKGIIQLGSLQLSQSKLLGVLLNKILKRLKQFYQQRTISGKGKKLSYQIRSQIMDLSDLSTQLKSKSSFQQIFQSLIKLITSFLRCTKLNKIPLFNPENPFKIIFNSLTASYNCFYLFITSLIIFFNADFGHSFHYFHQIAEVVWITEMIVQMNTAMYHNNQFTKDRFTIIKCYFKEYFFFEVIPLIFENFQQKDLTLNILFKLPLLLKLKGISIILNQLEFYILQVLKNHILLQLIKLIIQLVLLGHFLSCLWSVAIYYEFYYNNSPIVWSLSREIIEYDWKNRYFSGLYWAYTTMTNSQIYRPTTNFEMVFTSCCILISCILFGYLISSIGSILYDINKQNKEYTKDLNILNRYMKRKNIQLQ